MRCVFFISAESAAGWQAVIVIDVLERGRRQPVKVAWLRTMSVLAWTLIKL